VDADVFNGLFSMDVSGNGTLLGQLTGPGDGPGVALKPDACGQSHMPWAKPAWNILTRSSRVIKAGLSLDRSVVDRLAGVAKLPEPHQPANLPDYLDGIQIRSGVPIVD